MSKRLYTHATGAHRHTHPPLRWPALADNVSDAVATGRQDEYRAEQIYLRVLFDHGCVLPCYHVERENIAL